MANVLRDWSDLLAEFRKLGGTAENVRIGYGRLGRGLFAIDPSKPVDLHTPPNLLLPLSDMRFQNDRFEIAPAAKVGEAEKAWLELYLNEFSWGDGGREETTAEMERMRALPMPVRERLARQFGMDYCIGELSPHLVAMRFLDSRMITLDENTVMPMIDLVNHEAGRDGYDCTDGVAVRGSFSDEVLVSYSEAHDTFLCFRSWGMICERPFAFSIPARLPTTQGQLVVNINLNDARVIEWKLEKPMPLSVPNLTVENGKITLSFLMLGMKDFPRIPKGIFRRVVGDAGLQLDDEPFEIAQHVSRGAFLGMLRELEGAEGEAAGSLRHVCLAQLDALNQSYGSRTL